MDLKDLFIRIEFVLGQTIPAKVIEKGNIYELLSASFLAYVIAAPVAPAVADDAAGIKNNKKDFRRRGKNQNEN